MHASVFGKIHLVDHERRHLKYIHFVYPEQDDHKTSCVSRVVSTGVYDGSEWFAKQVSVQRRRRTIHKNNNDEAYCR